MSVDDTTGQAIETLLDGPNLADALESDRFKQFLDHVPFAIAVSQLGTPEHIVYANPEFERLTASAGAALDRQPWSAIPAAQARSDGRLLSAAIVAEEDFLGAFAITHGAAETEVDVWSNLIQNEAGEAVYRLVAIAESRKREDDETEDLVRLVQEKDTQLRELQHRVTNNLQMITALIRLEARNLPKGETGERFNRLAGRIHSLGVLYRSLSESGTGESVDLGSYLSAVASAVMSAHAVEGIRLNLKVDTWPVSVNVAMPTGLVVNELLTNALKHAFPAGTGGTITLQSLVDDTGCRVTVGDDGVGLGEGVVWPAPGKLSALIVQSLKQNAKASVTLTTAPGAGVKVDIFFARANASA